MVSTVDLSQPCLAAGFLDSCPLLHVFSGFYHLKRPKSDLEPGLRNGFGDCRHSQKKNKLLSFGWSQNLTCFFWHPTIYHIYLALHLTSFLSDILTFYLTYPAVNLASILTFNLEFSGVCFDDFSFTLSGILSGIYAEILSGIHSTWHLFWHPFWHSIWHLFWQSAEPEHMSDRMPGRLPNRMPEKMSERPSE